MAEPVTIFRAECFDDMASAVSGAIFESIQLASGRLCEELVRITLDRSVLDHGSGLTVPVRVRGTVAPGMLTIRVAMNRCRGILNGLPAGEPGLFVFRPGAEIDIIKKEGDAWATLVVPREELASPGRALFGGTFPEPDADCHFLPLSPGDGDALREAFQHVVRAARQDPRSFLDARVRESSHDALMTRLAGLLLSEEGSAPPAVPGRVRRRALRRAEDRLRELAGEPVYLSDLCAAAGVRERALRYAFHETFGLSPMEYLSRYRLSRIRQDLQSADPSTVTVREVASRWGMWHMGRFAGSYKALFGERPSETLLRSPCRRRGVPRRAHGRTAPASPE